MMRMLLPMGAALLSAAHTPMLLAGNHEPFDEFVPIVEINATDGDVGFHVLLDGEGWRVANVTLKYERGMLGNHQLSLLVS